MKSSILINTLATWYGQDTVLYSAKGGLIMIDYNLWLGMKTNAGILVVLNLDYLAIKRYTGAVGG